LADTVSSGNRRGYVAHWRVSAGELVLTSLMVYKQREDVRGRQNLYLEESIHQVFPATHRVVARWYSGIVVLRVGKRTPPLRDGRMAGPLKTQVFTFRQGRLLGMEELDSSALHALRKAKFDVYKKTMVYQLLLGIYSTQWKIDREQAETELFDNAEHLYFASE
jgi:hypothetical protein